MLQAIRERAQGILAWVILILITVPFALWGIQNYLGGGRERPVAVIGDQELFQRDVSRAYEQLAQSMVGFAGVDEAALRRQALDNLIREAVLSQEVENAGLVITDETVRSFIRSLNYFQADGNFDNKQYQAVLASQGMSSAQFMAKVRRARQMEQYRGGIVNTSFATPYDVDHFFRLQNQEREIQYVVVPLKETEAAVPEAEIESYYQAHNADYKTPERVSIFYIELSLDALAGAVETTEEALQAFYQEQKELYTSQERRRVSHVLVALRSDTDEKIDAAALEKAKAVRARLEKEDFAEVAKETSDDSVSAKKGGDLGLLAKGVMEKNFEEAALALGAGEISEPVRTAFGYHVIKVTELQPASVKPFDAVREEILKAYRRNQAENRFYEIGERLAELSYENPDNLSVAAEALGLKIEKSELFSRTEGGGIAAEEAVRKAAFSEDVLAGNNSEPVELGSDRIIVLRVDEHLPSQAQPLDKVRNQVVEALRQKRAEEAVQILAEALFQSLKGGKSLEAIAGEQSLEVKKPDYIARDKNDLPRELKRAAFKAAKPRENTPTPWRAALANGDRAIGVVLAVKETGADRVEAAQREIAAKSLAQAMGQSAFDALMDQLREDADVEIYRSAGDE